MAELPKIPDHIDPARALAIGAIGSALGGLHPLNFAAIAGADLARQSIAHSAAAEAKAALKEKNSDV